jgi:hypothetical protein
MIEDLPGNLPEAAHRLAVEGLGGRSPNSRRYDAANSPVWKKPQRRAIACTLAVSGAVFNS